MFRSKLLSLILIFVCVFMFIGLAEAQTWTMTGNMNVPRVSHIAIQLLDGKVLVAAGINSTGRTNTAELYDPTTGTWTLTGSLLEARDGPAVTKLQDGRVLLCGGRNFNVTLHGCEIYDPTTGTWSQTGSMNHSRIYPTLTLLPDGKVLVAGGFGGPGGCNCMYLNTAEIYDPLTGTWSFTSSMATTRWFHSATLMLNGKVLVAGGESYTGYYTGPGAPSVPYTEIYDPNVGMWSPTGNLNYARTISNAVLLPDGKVLVAGGGINSSCSYPIDSAEIYNPNTGTWSITGNLNEARIAPITLLPNGKVLIAGGPESGNCPNTINTSELYDITTGTWIYTDNLNQGRMSYSSTLLTNGNVLVAGGHVGSTFLVSAEIFNLPPKYTCVGFEPPMDNGLVKVKKNRVLPLKALLFDEEVLPVTDTYITALPVIQVLYDSGIGGDPVDVSSDALPAGLGTDGNQFVFTEDEKWQFNLKTKNYSASGTYHIIVVTGDDSEYIIDPTCEASFVIQ